MPTAQHLAPQTAASRKTCYSQRRCRGFSLPKFSDEVLAKSGNVRPPKRCLGCNRLVDSARHCLMIASSFLHRFGHSLAKVSIYQRVAQHVRADAIELLFRHVRGSLSLYDRISNAL